MKEEADGQREILRKDRQEQTEECGRSGRLLQLHDRTLKGEEQREKGKCRIKEGKLGISAM